MHHNKNESHDNTQQPHSNLTPYRILPQIDHTPNPERSAERQQEIKDRLHSTVRSTALRGMQSDSRLICVPSETTCETHRQCIQIKMQRGKTRFIYSLHEEVERQLSATIVPMYDHDTKTASLYQSRSPPNPTCRLIPTKHGRSSNFRHKYQGTRQNQGILKSEKSKKYLHVPIPRLKVPTSTHYMILAGQTYKPRNSGITKRREQTFREGSAQGDNRASEPCHIQQLEPWHPPLKESVPFYASLI